MTPDACRAIARRYFPLERRVVVAVGPARAIAPHPGAVRAGEGRPGQEDGLSGGSPPARVLLEDADLLAVDKPAGRLVIPGRSAGERSLREELEGTHGRLWVVHRLDCGTSGVLVFARTAAAHRALNMAFDRASRASATSRWSGASRRPSSGSISPSRPAGRVGCVPPGRTIRAASRRSPWSGGSRLTRRAPGRAGRSRSWRRCRRPAGRTRSASTSPPPGCPLAVDPDYGDAGPLRGPDGGALLDRTPLHAARLALRHPSTRRGDRARGEPARRPRRPPRRARGPAA